MAARLIGEEGRAAGQVLDLEIGEMWTVGRDPDEAMLVIEDPAVSRRHAICRATPEGYLLENLSETNPLSVNGRELLEPHLLVEGDQVKIGDTLFRFSVVEEAEEEEYDTLFGEPGPIKEAKVDLEAGARWLVKVITGPNTGAELTLQAGRTYTLGTDPATCDIVFHDLSVSRQHARVRVSEDEELEIEDLHSRNGVTIDGTSVAGSSPLKGNQVVALGTSSFVIIDREEARETLVPTPPKLPEAEPPPKEKAPEEKKKERPVLSGGAFILVLVAVGLIVIAVAGSLSLFKAEDVVVKHRDFNKELKVALAEFPDVRFTYNPSTGKLFLLGHVLTPVDKSELLYNLQGLGFINDIDDNVVVDQNIWEEFNAILSKHLQWTGVSMYASEPGQFVLSGYLETREQAVTLQDYLRINFPYLELLDDQVTVEEVLLEEVESALIQGGFASVRPELANGQVTLTGYIGRKEAKPFEVVVKEVKGMHGVRQVRNFVVLLADEQTVIDLTGRFNVQGFSMHDDATVNVLIDGRILARGDTFEGMEVVSIKSNAIILEKDGVKYKINYEQN
jgi:type III secretion system YscD/HrpQ family protein